MQKYFHQTPSRFFTPDSAEAQSTLRKPRAHSDYADGCATHELGETSEFTAEQPMKNEGFQNTLWNEIVGLEEHGERKDSEELHGKNETTKVIDEDYLSDDGFSHTLEALGNEFSERL